MSLMVSFSTNQNLTSLYFSVTITFMYNFCNFVAYKEMVTHMSNSLFRKEVALHAIMYILEKMGGSCDIHKICKILYFADQGHLSKYGRSITGDRYIAMAYGPVPSQVDDMFKAVRGDSYFSNTDDAKILSTYFGFRNRFIVEQYKTPDMDYLSESDVEVLDASIAFCRDKGFEELTRTSHGLAWNNTKENRAISTKDILREIGDDEEYASYIESKMEVEANCFS